MICLDIKKWFRLNSKVCKLLTAFTDDHSELWITMSYIVCLPLLLHWYILVHNTVQSDTLASYHIKEPVTVITLQRFHWSFVTEYLFMVFIRTIACVFNQKIKKLQKAASRRQFKELNNSFKGWVLVFKVKTQPLKL